MPALIDSLFPKSESDAIRKLWKEDVGSRHLLKEAIAQKIIGSDEILNQMPLTQLMFVASLSPFASSDEECTNIATIVYWSVNKRDIFPLITCHRGKELAFRCLISLSFFEKALTKKWKRRGAPSPSYYRAIGINTFNQIGMPEIGVHFHQWEGFLPEMLVI